MGILPHFLLAGALFMIDLPCVQKNWIFPLKDVRLKTPLDNNQTGPSGRLIVVEGVLRRTSYYQNCTDTQASQDQLVRLILLASS